MKTHTHTNIAIDNPPAPPTGQDQKKTPPQNKKYCESVTVVAAAALPPPSNRYARGAPRGGSNPRSKCTILGSKMRPYLTRTVTSRGTPRGTP